MDKITANPIWQIGIVVADAKAAAEKAMRLFGLQLDHEGAFGTHGGYEHCNTHYKGKPTDGSGYGYCLKMGETEVEFIQPVGDEPSIWGDFLKAHPNGGIHHIAWRVKDTEETTRFLHEAGIEKLGDGVWETGKYTYYDGAGLGFTMEALEFYDERKMTD